MKKMNRLLENRSFFEKRLERLLKHESPYREILALRANTGVER
jgi:hypothetical protein